MTARQVHNLMSLGVKTVLLASTSFIDIAGIEKPSTGFWLYTKF